MTMKRYPTEEYVRDITSAETIAELVAELGKYDREETIATFTGDYVPAVLRAWLDLYEAVRKVYGTTVSMEKTSLAIKRDRTPAELESVVIGRLRSDRYYHPENFADITEAEIEDKS